VTPDELLAIADEVVGRAQPGEELEAVVTWSHDTEVRAYDGQVEHFVAADSAGVGVRIVRDGRQGLSWVGVLDDPSALDECVAEARDNAAFGTPDPSAGLAAPDGVAASPLELFDERLLAVPTDDKIAMAIDLERRVLGADPRMVGLESADYADSVGASAIASTTGIRAAGAETSAFLGSWALAGDGAETTTGFGFSVGRTAQDLDPDAAADDAVRRCLSMLGATKAPSERLTVVFDPYVTSQFLGLVAELLSGEAVLRGRSTFAGRLGDSVAAESITLFDDPCDPLAPTADDIDGEGLACRRVPLLADGVLEGYLHNAYTARSSGVASTGSAQRGSHRSVPGVGPRVVKLQPGPLSVEQVWGQVGDGLLVQEVSGLHSGVNPVSGDLSVGVEGRRLRGGAPAEAVREVTIGSTLQRMLLDVVAVGGDLTYFPWEATGVTLAIADVTMSGT
jgi:PmbA protein